MIRTLIGDKAFYKRLFSLMIPIMLQNGITNFVNMLDNIMIGAVGTAPMTGVAITNQLLFVFNLCIFGIVSGAGIFGAQFFGCGNTKGVQYTFRFKILVGSFLSLCAIVLFLLLGTPLLSLYMQGEQTVTDTVATMQNAQSYLSIMLIGLVPFTLVQCYSSTLRECGHPTLPLVAGIVAILVNLTLNYLLIFGKCGLPALGVKGAALATVISRFAELVVIVVASHRNAAAIPFINGVYRSLFIPAKLFGSLLVKGLPLMLNETMWATGLAVVNQCYSVRGLDAVAACNISQTFWNIFSIAYMAVGAAASIIVGQTLGAGLLKEAKQNGYRLIAFSFLLAFAMSILYAISAEFIPLAYNTTDEIRHLSTRLMQISALMMPFDALVHAAYFTVRSGGKMMITALFDCGFMWGGNVLLAFLLSHFTSISFVWIFAIIQGISIVKSVFGIVLVRSGFWVRNIVSSQEGAA